MTEIKQSASSKTDTAEPSTTTATSQTVKKTSIKNQPAPAPKNKSMLTIFALLLAIIAIAGCAGLYYWFQQQNISSQNAFNSKLKQQVQLEANTQKAQLQQLLNKQQTFFSNQLAALQNNINADNQSEIEQLKQSIARLQKNQPSDWLIHEAEYLIRVATRSLWLKKDTTAAIGLLVDADQRLKQLNDPKFLAVREIIHQDIENLKLLPALQTENTLLSLMALEKQVRQLTLALAYVTSQEETNKEELGLSNSENDWQENLRKSWQKFIDSFISIRRLDNSIEPLLTPQQQQNLSTNLKLKLQQAQWSVSKGNVALFNQQISDIQQWVKDYFDMDNIANQQFVNTVEKLRNNVIHINLPTQLNSLSALSTTLKAHTYTDAYTKSPTEPKIKESAAEKQIESKVIEQPTVETTPAVENDKTETPESTTPKEITVDEKEVI